VDSPPGRPLCRCAPPGPAGSGHSAPLTIRRLQAPSRPPRVCLGKNETAWHCGSGWAREDDPSRPLSGRLLRCRLVCRLVHARAGRSPIYAPVFGRAALPPSPSLPFGPRAADCRMQGLGASAGPRGGCAVCNDHAGRSQCTTGTTPARKDPRAVSLAHLHGSSNRRVAILGQFIFGLLYKFLKDTSNFKDSSKDINVGLFSFYRF
jgi:hypothetical protein